MNRSREVLPEKPLADRKAQDRALLLPLVGLLLLIPPIANLFQLDVRFAGVPFTALYLFFVWAALIAGAAALSPRLRDSDRSRHDVPAANDSER